jgi:hypothetical protein
MYYGDTFDKDSICFEINGIDLKHVIVTNKNFVSEFNIEKILVKDLETGKIFIMNIRTS